ncbi:MAG: hypothetical protein NPIRA03_00370 [Nitrospirales bacterium]|nr:MAG: hypothetical protein NPIRA03_00370 [Nitrospirales bacterium]
MDSSQAFWTDLNDRELKKDRISVSQRQKNHRNGRKDHGVQDSGTTYQEGSRYRGASIFK